MSKKFLSSKNIYYLTIGKDRKFLGNTYIYWVK